MKMFFRQKIEKQIVIGFAILITVFACFGLTAMYDLNHMSVQMRGMYDHPLIVSNAAMEAKVAISKISSAMKDLVSISSFGDVEGMISEMNRSERMLIKSLDTVRARTLHERGKMIESRIRQQFFEWEPVRDEIISEVSQRKFMDAKKRFDHEGKNIIHLMEGLADELTQCSREQAISYILRAERVDKKIRLISWVFLAASFPFCFLVALVTIRNSSRIEAALRESEERFSTAFENANIGVFLVRPDLNILRVNHKLSEILNYSKKELESMSIRQITHPDDMAVTLDFVHRSLDGAMDKAVYEKRYLDRNGQTVHCSVTTSLIRTGKGVPLYYIGHALDITERKKAHDKSRELERQLIQSQKMEAIGRLAGGVAHDFNNLLSIILGYSEMLVDEIPYEHPHHELISEIHDASIRAQGLTRQLLAFGRKQVLEIVCMDVNEAIRGFESLLRRVISEDVTLNVFLEDRPARIKADRSQIEQVLMNLVVNAKDAMPNGGILSIETAHVDLDDDYVGRKMDVKPGRYIMIAVCDTGTGIDPEVLDHIYEPFFTTKKSDKGTGLGLSTVYGIVTQHGGTIWVYSEKGHGTTFKIYLPEEHGDFLDNQKKTGDGETLVRGSARVMIVEDDHPLALLAKRILFKQGYHVITTESTHDAIFKARESDGPLDLLITDVIMPDMKGPEVFEAIKEIHPQVKVLYMSGYTGNVITRHGVLKEGTHFLQKPFSKQMLLKKVEETLNQA